MMIDSININASGKVELKLWDDYNIIYNQTLHNAILPQHKEILSLLLSNIPTGAVDQIIAYDYTNNTTIVAIGKINQINHLPLTNEVEFITVFNEVSFNGRIGKLSLKSNGSNKFMAEILSLDITKTNLQLLSVVWKIKIN